MILSPPLVFRPIDPDRDAMLCAANHRDACITSFGDEEGYNGGANYLNWLRARVEEFPDGHVLAYSGNECIGQLEVQVPYGLKVCYANLYYVSQPFRGQGYGRRLHEFAERYARSWEAKRIELHVSPSNPRAIGFYRKMGFALMRVEQENKRRMWRMSMKLG